MVAISPADLLTKLRVFFCVVICLFGVMHLGAFIGAVQGAHCKKRMVERIKTEEFSFKEHEDGSWTWRLVIEALEKDTGVPDGNLLLFSQLVGARPAPASAAALKLPGEVSKGVPLERELVG